MMVNDRSISASSVVAMNASIGLLRCGDCDAVFNNQSSLSRHEKTHWAALRCRKDGCEKAFSSHKHLSKHLNRHSDTNLVVRIVPFNIRTKVEIKQELNDDDVSGGSASVRHFIIKKEEEEEGEFKVKIEIKNEPAEKCNVQLCKRVKKEENDEDGKIEWDGDECDCDECRVERVIKQEHDQTGEKEMDRNNGKADRDCVKDKKEEEEYDGKVNIEVKRPNKKQRIDKMTEEEDKVPLGTSKLLPTVHFSNYTELEDDLVDQIDDDKLNVNDGEDDDDDTEVDEEYDAENYDESGDELSVNEQMDDDEVDEENEDSEMDEESEQNESVSNGLVQKNFVRQIEPDELGNRFECDYEGCGKRYKKNSTLIYHIRRHTGEKPFKCSWDNCCRAYNRKDRLNEHLNTHTGNCPFVCTWSGCNARFKQRANLKRHSRIHLNDRRHRCDWPGCVKAFFDLINLKRHRLRHTGERPHKCDWPGCVQAFTDKTNLKVHQRIHTKERPFTCNKCVSAFSQKTNLSIHYRRKHSH